MTNLQSEINSLFGYHDDFEENPDAYWFYASNANGINDLGQVVGSHFYDYDEAFVYGGGQNINLHSLLGDDVRNSTAHHINNEGQIIGTFNTRGSNYTTFVYNDGEINTLGSSLFDLNNKGIAVGSSGATATLYDIENDTSTNLNTDSTIDSEEAIWLSSAQGINDEGQIAASGYFTGDTGRTINAFLLNPQFAEPELEDYINIGNITTFGDTVLLQGNEITLSGNAITTQGGEITFDGATKVNANLTIDSSVTEDEVITDGGDITFTGTLDAASAASGNLRLQAGTGNILFSETVGGEATFRNINVLGADIVTATADITSDQLVRINATGNIVTQNITSDNSRVVVSSQEKSISTLDITSGSESGDHIVLQAGDRISTKNLSANELGTVRIASGGYLEQDITVVGDITTESITGQRIRVESTGNFTASGDAIAHDGNVVVDAKQDITTENITADNGNVRLISEEKSVTAKDITSGSDNEKGNIILEGVEGVRIDNLNAYELGVVRIKSGKVVDTDTSPNGTDDTVEIGSIITDSITGKRVDASSTGGFTAIGDIIAHDGKITITTHDDIQTKKIESVTRSINLVSTDGEVTVDGELISGKGGIGIIAKNDITTQKINSVDGVVGLSSFDGSVIVEDDITTVKGGVVIAGKAGVEVKNITTQVGEVNIGSGSDIDVNGKISTGTGYIDIKTSASISAQTATTNKGFVEIAAGGIATANIATGLGTSTLVSVANLDDEILIAGNADGNLSSTVTRPQDLSDEEAILFTEFVQSTVYRTRPLGEFVLGALYEWTHSNGDDIRGLMPGFLKLDEKEEARLNARLNQSQAFELGRLLGEGAAVAQGIYEFVTGLGAITGGKGLCITGIGCFAGAPAIASGVVLSVHGGKLAVNSATEFGDKLSDILSPNRMASSGGADDVIGLSKETGISQGSINNVYDDLNPSDIKLLGDKLNKNNVENLFGKADGGNTGSQLVQNVTKIVKIFVDDVDAVADIERTLSANKPNKKGVIDITDTQLENAFSDNLNFLQKYKNKVSGAFSYTFGRSKSTTLDPNQALGEIKAAEDFLDGKALLKNDGTGQSFLTEIDNVTALSDLRTSGGSVKVPDYSITEINGATRLLEVKTPFKKMLPKRIRNSVKGAVEQIVEYNTLSNSTEKGIIRLDYRSSTAPSDLPISTIEKTVKDRLNVVIDASTNTKGSDFVGFVEVIYEDSSQLNSIQRLVIKID